MVKATHLRQHSRNRLLGGLLGTSMVLMLMALPFLGSAGCGCGDDRFPIVRDQPAVCCCEFVWMPGRNVMDQDVNVTFVGVDPSLHPFAQPSLLLGATADEFSTFRICVRDDHVIGASMTVELRDAGTSSLLGSAELLYTPQCAPVIELLGETILYATDCGGQVLQRCCTYGWLPDLDDEDVVLSVVGASPSLQPVVVPTTFTGVINEVQTFSVCVNVDHALGSTLTLEFRDTSGATLFGSTVLTYGVRCDPTIEPGPRTTIYSTDCGGGVCGCVEAVWVPTSPGSEVDAIRIELENVDVGLNPTATPHVVTGVRNSGFAVFTVCASPNHPLSAQMQIVMYDDATNEEVWRVPIMYPLHCTPAPVWLRSPDLEVLGESR